MPNRSKDETERLSTKGEAAAVTLIVIGLIVACIGVGFMSGPAVGLFAAAIVLIGTAICLLIGTKAMREGKL